MISQITINPIGGQVSGIPFAVSGTATLFPALSYAVDADSFAALTSGAVVSAFGTVNWSFEVPGLASGSHTIAVDETSTSGAAVSNTFAVSLPPAIVPNAPSGAVAGQSFVFTGTLDNYTQVPPLQFRFDTGTFASLSGVTVSGWSTTLTAPVSGSHTVTVTDGNVSGVVSFSVAHVPQSITPNVPAGSVAGLPFTFSGSIAGFDDTPALTYSLDGGTGVSLPGVILTGWSTPLTVSVSGSHTLSVSDVSGASGLVSFTTATSHVITPTAPSGVIAGAAFPFTGSISGFTSAPSLFLKVDGGTETAMTGVAVSGWSTSVTLSTSGTHTLTVTDNVVSGATSTTAASPVTWNPADKTSNVTLSNGNKTATISGGSPGGVRATVAIAASGTVPTAFEIKMTTLDSVWVGGVADSTFNLTFHGGIGVDIHAIGTYPSTAAGQQNPQSVYWNNGGLYFGTVSSSAGETLSIIVSGTHYWASDETQRAATGIIWNGSNTADPATGVGGLSFSGIGSTLFPAFQDSNGVGAATINGGDTAFSTFLTTYMAAHPSIKALGGPAAPVVLSLSPNSPVGAVSGVAFTFTGTVNGYAAAPSGMTYKLDGGTATALSGVTVSGWSTSLTINASGSHSLSVSDVNGVSGSTSFSVAAAPPHALVPNSPSGVIVGSAFNFTGTATGYVAAPSGMTYQLDAGTATALTGVTVSGWSESFTMTASGAHTLSVADVNGVSGLAFFHAAASGVTAPGLVVGPLTGAVTAGTWITNLRLVNAAMPNGFMQYNVLLPANWSASSNNTWAMLVYGHMNDQGMNGTSYPRDGNTLINQDSINGWCNTVAFRTAFPCIVLVPQYDQSQDTSGASPNSNGGGYADSPNSGGNEQTLLLVVQSALAAYKGNANAVIGTGDSLGAIACLAQLVDNNIYNGVHKVWAAAMGFSDQLFRPSVPNSGVFPVMANVPYIAVSTPSDNNAAIYDQAGWQAYTGGTSYPTPAAFAAGGVAAIKAGSSQFYYIDTPTGNPWDTYRKLDVDGGQGTKLYQLLFSFIPGWVTAAGGGTGGVTASPDKSVITAPTTGTLVDNVGNAWGINSAGAVTVNGVVDTTTANVITMAWVSGSIWQENTSLLWWSKTSPTDTWSPQNGTPISPLAVHTPTGAFKVSNGLIQDPNGNNFLARGIDVIQEQLSTVCTSAACTPLLTLYPGLNMLRVPFLDYSDPSGIATAVAHLTAKGIVVEIEDHTGISQQPATGSALATQQAWYSAAASLYKNNPYVWFGTPNEPYPVQTNNGDDVTTQHVETYNTIRATGNTNPIMICLIGGGNPGNLPGGNSTPLTAGRYASMTNVLWDLHQYDYEFPAPGGYSTNETTISSGIAGYIARIQTVTSADGVMPVIIGEFGDSTDGVNVDPGAVQLVDAVGHCGHGFLAWAWTFVTPSADRLTTDSSGSSLTSYGAQVAGLIAAAAAADPASSPRLTVSNGGIHANGIPFLMKGIAVMDTEMAVAITDSGAHPLRTDFPGVNIVRLACHSYQAPTFYDSFVTTLTGLGIYVHIEDHSGVGGGSGVMVAGVTAAAQQAWYANLATHYLANPYVSFGTMNEPSNSPVTAGVPVPGTVTNNHVTTYQTIRNTGSRALIEMEMVGGGTPSGFGFSPTEGANNTAGLFPNSAYASMTNIIWGPHFYNWQTNFSTTLQDSIDQLHNVISLCKQITSADGTVPVAITEFGVATNATTDPGGIESVNAVIQLNETEGLHAICWAWGQFQSANSTTDGSNALISPWGTDAAAWLS